MKTTNSLVVATIVIATLFSSCKKEADKPYGFIPQTSLEYSKFVSTEGDKVDIIYFDYFDKGDAIDCRMQSGTILTDEGISGVYSQNAAITILSGIERKNDQSIVITGVNYTAHYATNGNSVIEFLETASGKKFIKVPPVDFLPYKGTNDLLMPTRGGNPAGNVNGVLETSYTIKGSKLECTLDGTTLSGELDWKILSAPIFTTKDGEKFLACFYRIPKVEVNQYESCATDRGLHLIPLN